MKARRSHRYVDDPHVHIACYKTPEGYYESFVWILANGMWWEEVVDERGRTLIDGPVCQ
jgi:hypothetical protein